MLAFNFVAFVVCLFPFALAGPAPLSKDNPRNIVAVADFPESGPNKFTKGYVYFTSPTGDSVKVHVDMTGLPTSGGPFLYHIHEGQIFNQKKCDEAGKHFDPFKGLAKCPNPGDDALCMVGDLSGKHGWINTTCFQTEYFEKFISLNPASESFIVGRSLVFHDQKLTRFACANINLASAEQYRDLFGAPGKNSGSHNSELDTSASHVPVVSNPGRVEDPKQQPPANPAPANPAPANPAPANPAPANPAPANPAPANPAPAPANPQPPASPAPNPAPPTPTSAPAPAPAPQPAPAPIKASSPPKLVESTTTVTSTVGAVASPTSSGNSDAGSNRFIHRATESLAPAALLSSDASSGNLFKGFIGTVFGVLLGIFF